MGFITSISVKYLYVKLPRHVGWERGINNSLFGVCRYTLYTTHLGKLMLFGSYPVVQDKSGIGRTSCLIRSANLV